MHDTEESIVASEADRIGYKSINVWPEATPELARIVAVDPQFQSKVDGLFRDLAHKWRISHP